VACLLTNARGLIDASIFCSFFRFNDPSCDVDSLQCSVGAGGVLCGSCENHRTFSTVRSIRTIRPSSQSDKSIIHVYGLISNSSLKSLSSVLVQSTMSRNTPLPPSTRASIRWAKNARAAATGAPRTRWCSGS